MDIKDKLELLKKQRALRGRTSSASRPGRSERVQEAWEKIDRDEALTVKEKLQKLITLTGTKPGQRPAGPRRGEAEAPPQAVEPFQVFDNSYGLQVRYGRTLLAQGLEVKGDVLSLLGRSGDFEGLDLSTALFIDLETTGLSGGTGTVPFLVGMGFYHEDRFRVVQYFLHDIGAEEEMVQDLARFFKEMGFRSVVSYNGRAFDLPILETRFVLKRQPFRLADLPHLDFLPPARILWKHKHLHCPLCHLAREVIQADRSEDIPSAEIPIRYFQYLRSRDFSLIEPILYHNQEDILSLLGLVISGAMLVLKGRGEGLLDEEVDGMDLFGVGKVFERAGQSDQSVRVFERALGGRLSSDVALQARIKLSRHYKKQGHYQEAVSIWQELVSQGQLASYRELAMHYEHRDKNYEEALRFTEEGLALSREVFSSLHGDFSLRLKRLKVKEQRGKKGRKAK